ncbi:hypothetical protein EK21DRAFT_91967 [Setomelanomma holmii]|uniref:Uncharacterized protein n=1 Tax=Setomelanomma holmii TaxID=210430 RepID=A0A9P4H4Q0_9PLEO|nr:hypothetical protein EK21DRAFT_91967 [Setomelanomma holmii]
MPSTNLIIALSFAAVFGTALVWLAIYYVHRYIHLCCLELDHWLHLFTPPAWRKECRHCEGTGRVVKVEVEEGQRSRSRGRRRRSKSGGRSDKMKGHKMLEAGDAQWKRDTDGNVGQEHVQMRRSRPALPASPMQRQGMPEQYNPWSTWQGQGPIGPQMGIAYPPQMAYPAMQQQAYPQTYPQNQALPHPYPQLNQQAAPFAMPPVSQHHHQPSSTAMPVASPISSPPMHQKHHRRTYGRAPSIPSEPAPQPKSARNHEARVRKVDYIHIVDDLPPMVKEAIAQKKSRAKSPSPPSSSPSSSSSEVVEEVPRAEKPGTTKIFGDTSGAVPFQFPPYPGLSTRVWGEAPTSWPRQWGGNGNMGGNATGGGTGNRYRYVSPYERPKGRMEGQHSIRNEEASGRKEKVKARERKEDVMDRGQQTGRASAARRRKYAYGRKERERSERYGSQEQTIERETANPNAQPHPGPRNNDSNTQLSPKSTKPTADETPAHDQVPHLSPMPIPTVEEPASDIDLAKGKRPIIRGMSTDQVRPSAPSVPTPFVDIRSPSNSALSAVSSLHD